MAEQDYRDEIARRFAQVSQYSGDIFGRNIAQQQVNLQRSQILAGIESQAFRDYLAGREQDWYEFLSYTNMEQDWYKYQVDVLRGAAADEADLLNFFQWVFNESGPVDTRGALGGLEWLTQLTTQQQTDLYEQLRKLLENL